MMITKSEDSGFSHQLHVSAKEYEYIRTSLKYSAYSTDFFKHAGPMDEAKMESLQEAGKEAAMAQHMLDHWALERKHPNGI